MIGLEDRRTLARDIDIAQRSGARLRGCEFFFWANPDLCLRPQTLSRHGS